MYRTPPSFFVAYGRCTRFWEFLPLLLLGDVCVMYPCAEEQRANKLKHIVQNASILG